MEKIIEKVIELRKKNKLKEALNICKRALENYPDNPELNYQCGWCHDVLELEEEAIPYYEKAIKNGLDGESLEGAYLGLGSTYRTLGKYEKSVVIFKEGLGRYPHNLDLEVFYAMTLYNLGRYNESTDKLLKIIANTSEDKNIKLYRKAILYYSDKLDKVF